MRIRTIISSLAVATAALVAVAEPADAAPKPKLSIYGDGTWTTDGVGAQVSGETLGTPFNGTTTGWIAPNDGSNPPWAGCEPGSGELTTTSADGRTLTLELWGDICTAVSPAGRLTFKGWYTVTHFDGKGGRVADGVGGLDVRTLADGTSQWMIDGQLY